MVNRASRKSKNAYILERREPSLSAEHVCRAFFACAHDKVHMTVICTTNRFLTRTFYRAHDKLFAVRFQFRMAKKARDGRSVPNGARDKTSVPNDTVMLASPCAKTHTHDKQFQNIK
jgi:hypothetical protein